MPLLSRTDPSLERALLRKGVGARSAAAKRCADCGRAPLVGERLYAYDGGRVACELCRTVRREDPVSSELVHSPEHGHAVRLTIRAA
jgi:hypothetical protein